MNPKGSSAIPFRGTIKDITMAKSSKSAENTEVSVSASELASALTAAIEAAKPPAKKSIFTRKPNTPWTPKDGGPKLKLKRKIFQHSIPVLDKFLTNEQVAALNKLRPGAYFDGYVKVTRRRDKGIDITYPMKNPQQRIMLTSKTGARTFTELIHRMNEEAAKPKRSEFDLNDE
jgi:hypothetical protein